MKQTLLFGILAVITMAPPATAAHYQVYLLGGQSNGNGRADAAQLASPLNAPQTDVRFYWHRTQAVNNVGHIPEDTWTDLAPGSGHGTGAPVYAKEFGPEVSFGRAMADAKPTQNIAIIKYTHGGSNLYSNWAAGGPRYTSFISTVQAGLAALTNDGHTYELRGMLWQQGESDTGGSNADNYQANLTSLISRVRNDVFASGPLPFLIGTISNSQYSNITTPGSGPYKVRQAQETVAAADPAVEVAITDNYDTRINDSIHFNHDGQIALGQNFATQMLSLEGPDLTAPVIVTTNPTNTSSGAAVGENLLATFSETITLVDGGTVTLRDFGPGADVIITLPDTRVTTSGSDLIIDPSTDLSFQTQYAIRISDDALSDQAMPANFFDGIDNDTTWTFTTGTTEPVVTTLLPADNSSGAATDDNLFITFDEPVQKGATGTLVIKENGGTTFETIPINDPRVSVSGAVVTINPTGTFSPGAGYHVQISDGAITDLGGNSWSGIPVTDTTTWNFEAFFPANSIGTTGVFDENINATNQLDIELTPGTLAPFKAAVSSAYDNNLGGVIDWETGLTATPSSGPTPGNSLTGTYGAIYGPGASSILNVTFDRSMDLYTNNINNQVNVLSGLGAFDNALIPSGGNATVGLEYTITFTGGDLVELGAAIPSRSTYATQGVDFRATASFSNGSSEVVDFTVSGTIGAGDTFLRFVAPAGEAINSLTVAYLDDNGQNLANGQRRPILDDLGFIVAPPANTFASWVGDPAFDLPPSEQGFGDDPDGDGLPNGVEALLGTNPGEFSAGITNLATDGVTTTFTHPQNETPLSNLTGSYEWSQDLNNWYPGDGMEGPVDGPTVTITSDTVEGTTNVTATASEPLGSFFLRITVQN